MATVVQLSSLTGIPLRVISRILQIEERSAFSYQLKVEDLRKIHDEYGNRYIYSDITTICLLIDEVLYDGIIVHASFTNLSVVYCDPENNRQLVYLQSKDKIIWENAEKSIIGVSLQMYVEDFNITPSVIDSFYDIIFENDSISVGKCDKGYFFVDSENYRISTYFQDIKHDPIGLYILSWHQLYGLADSSGKIILKPKYLTIDTFSEGLARVQTISNWGYIDCKGDIIIPPLYNSADNFKNGIAKVTLKDLSCDSFSYNQKEATGYINTKGCALLKDNHDVEFPEFYFVSVFHNIIVGRKYIIENEIHKVDHSRYYIPKGEINSNITIKDSKEGILSKWLILYDLSSKLYGAITKDGNSVISCVFNSIIKMSDEYIIGDVPSVKEELPSLLETNDEGWGYFREPDNQNNSCSLSRINLDGVWLFSKSVRREWTKDYNQCVELKSKHYPSEYGVAYLYYVELKGKFGIVDSNGIPQIEIQYDEIIIPSLYHDYDFGIQYHDTEHIEYNGRSTYASCYNCINLIPDFKLFARKDNNWYLYAFSEFKVDRCYSFNEIHRYNNDLYLVKQNHYYGIINDTTNIIDAVYDKILYQQQGNYRYFLVYKENKIGLYVFNSNCSELILHLEAVYKSIQLLLGYIIVQDLNDSYGVFNIQGKTLIPINKSNISYIPSTNSFLISENQKYGIYDSDGTVLVPVKYDNIDIIGKLYISVLGNKKIILNGEENVEVDDVSILDTISYENGELINGKEKHNRFYLNNTNYVIKDAGLYLIQNNECLGVIDHHCQEIVPCKYSRLGLVCSNVLLASDGNKMTLYSTDGLVMSDAYDVIIPLPSYKARFEYPTFYVYLHTKIGFLTYRNRHFNLECPIIFDDFYWGDKHCNFEDRHIIDNQRYKTELLGFDGNLTSMPDNYVWMSDYNYSGLAIAADRLGQFVFLTHKNLPIDDQVYSNILKIDAFHYLTTHKLCSKPHDASCKDVISTIVKFDRALNKQVIESYKFNVIRRLVGTNFIIEHNNKYGVIKYDPVKETIENILEPIYNNINCIDEIFIVVNYNGLYGCFNLDGRLLLEMKYSSISQFKPSRFIRCKEDEEAYEFVKGKYLFADTRKDKITRYIYCYLNGIITKLDSSVTIRPHYYHSLRKEMVLCYEYKNGFQFSTLDLTKFSDIYTKFIDYGSGCKVAINDRWGYLDFRTFDQIPCHYKFEVFFAEESHRFWMTSDKDTKITQIYDSKLKKVCNIPHVNYIKHLIDEFWLISTKNEFDYCSSSKLGLYNNKLECVIPVQYDEISPGINNQFIAYSYNNYGQSYAKIRECVIYDNTGVEIFKCSDKIVVTTDDDQKEYYVILGEVSSLSYDGKTFQPCPTVVKTKDSEIVYISSDRTHYYSGKNTDGTTNIVTSFATEYFFVQNAETYDGITILRINNKYIAISRYKELTPNSYDKIYRNYRDKYLLLVNNTQKIFIDYDGCQIGKIEGDFDSCYIDKEADVIVCTNTNEDRCREYLLYSTNGDLLNTTPFSYIGNFCEGFAPCVINSEYTIDEKFINRVSSKYLRADEFENYGQWGLINNKGEIVIPMKYDFIRTTQNGLSIFVKKPNFGILNPYKRKSIITEFEYLHYFSEGLCLFRTYINENGSESAKCGYIDVDGKVRIPALFDDGESFNNGKAVVKSRSGYINEINVNGELLRDWRKNDCKYDEDYDRYDMGYTQQELDDMYLDAMGGDLSNEWNID